MADKKKSKTNPDKPTEPTETTLIQQALSSREPAEGVALQTEGGAFLDEFLEVIRDGRIDAVEIRELIRQLREVIRNRRTR